MARLGRAEVTGGRLRTIDQMNAALRRVTAADICSLAAQFLDAPQVKVTVSPTVS